MALDQNAQYPVGTAAPTADYPEGSAINETVLDALDGFPWEKEGINDRFGFEQALLRITGQAASGSPDTALVSQYLQGVIELASGRATAYDDGGAADAYVMDLRTGQQYAAGLFIGLTVKFTPANDGTGAATLDYNGAVDALVSRTGNVLTGGELVTSIEATAVFDGADWRLMTAVTLELQPRINTTSGTAINVGSIPSWAQRITINFHEVSTNGTQAFKLELGDSGGIETAGYIGGFAFIDNISPSSASTVNRFGLSAIGDASKKLSGSITLNLAESATNTWALSGTLIHEDGTGTPQIIYVAGIKALSSKLTQFEIATLVAETFDGGWISAAYE